MTRSAVALAILALTSLAAPAAAVGLGPLLADGVTNSERKGFYLTLINPYLQREQFRLYSVGLADEQAQTRVMIPANAVALAASSQRRILVIAADLQPGETYRFRVCAERVDLNEGPMLHARVCSKLTARRLG